MNRVFSGLRRGISAVLARRRLRLSVLGAAIASLLAAFLVPQAMGRTAEAADCPWVGSDAPVADRVAQLMAKMTVEQKTDLLHGNGKASPYIGNTDAIPELCVPALGLQDGPAGVGDGMGGVTQLPAPVSLAATFDPEAQQSYGKTAGAEFHGKGADVALGPTANIVRDPRWGRNFETYGEDPYLNGQTATNEIQGLQSQGVMAQVKHTAAYNIERGAERGGTKDNAIVDDRTLHEIYLPAFQEAITKGKAASAMCAYNQVNGVYSCENPDVLNKGLYDEAKFDGFVTSDWGAAHDNAAKLANGGMTQEMPGSAFYGQGLQDAVGKGEVSKKTLDAMVTRVLTQMFRFGLFDKKKTGDPKAKVTTPEHVETAKKLAEQGSVLLKNDDNALPLNPKKIKSIAISGGDAVDAQTSGGGSATTTTSGTVLPGDAIKKRAGDGVDVTYTEGAGERTKSPDIDAAAAAAKKADVAIVFASYSEQEATDLDGIDLPGKQNDLIDAVSQANPNTIVVLNTGSAVTMPWLSKVKGVIEGWYPGQQDGNAVADLLFGDTNFSGKLPVTFPKSLKDVPAATSDRWPGNDKGIEYSEGLDVGYRWYDAKKIEPLFPFGYGLSYTTFGYSGLKVDGGSDGNATVTATVKNTGSKEGADVAQLYVSNPAADKEPPQQLKGYRKVSLKPGASTTVTFTLTPRDLAHWDSSGKKWATSSGEYGISVGDSSRDKDALTGKLTVG